MFVSEVVVVPEISINFIEVPLVGKSCIDEGTAFVSEVVVLVIKS